MTLILLSQNDLGFECYADSLVNFHQGSALKTYGKTLILPVSYRITREGTTTTRDHKFGMAIAGNLAAATAVYSILSGAAQSLHSHVAMGPPREIDLINLALKISQQVYEDMKPLGEDGFFGFFLFGHDISTKTPFAVKFSTEKINTGGYGVVPRRCIIGVDQVSLLGSGSAAFEQEMREKQGKGIPISDLFYDFVRSGRIPSVGGIPQLLIAVENGVSIEPVLIGSDDGSDCKIYHSGMEMGGYKSVGDYMVGFKLRGINMAPFDRSQSLKAQGYDPNDSSITAGEANQALIAMLLKRHLQPDYELPYNGVLSVSCPREITADSYAGYVCPRCGEFNGIWDASSINGRKPFSNSLSLSIDCANCSSSFQSPASEFGVQ